MQGLAPQSTITGVPGWESDAEQEYLLHKGAGVPEDGVIVEIGGEFGMSASLFAKGAKADVDIYTVDLFPGTLLAMHKANLAEAGYGNRTNQVTGDSKTIGKNWRTPIDLLFVDGDHSYGGALHDLTIWSAYVKPLGVIAVHDCVTPANVAPHALHFEVTQAVNEWLLANKDEFIEIEGAGTIRAFARLDNVANGNNAAKAILDAPTTATPDDKPVIAKPKPTQPAAKPKAKPPVKKATK